MSLSVLQVAWPFAPVGVPADGPAECMLGHLDRALVLESHSSIVIAHGDSQTAGTLVPLYFPTRALLNRAQLEFCYKRVQSLIDRTLAERRVDVIHLHDPDFHRYKLPSDIPVLITLHNAIHSYPAEIWTRYGSNVQFCCVSAFQRRTCPPELEEAVVIEDGVVLPNLSAFPCKDDFALVLGRIAPEANTHEALRAGSLADTPVFLAGEIFAFDDHMDYFDLAVAPLLEPKPDQVTHRYFGALDWGESRAALARAKCLILPSLAHTTTSHLAMQALAAGTPVIAYATGALPEIIENGVTGFLVNSVGQMADALRQVDRLSPAACRQAAVQRFTSTRMTRRYLDLYEYLALGRQFRRLSA